jgi:phage shock protein A
MSALDKMVAALMSASGINVEDVKEQVTTRIANFEQNVTTLNNTLISIMETQRRIEHNLKRICAALNIPYEDAPPLPAPKLINGEARADGR